MAQFTQICAMDLPYFSANCWMLPRRSLSSSIFKPGNGMKWQWLQAKPFRPGHWWEKSWYFLKGWDYLFHPVSLLEMTTVGWFGGPPCLVLAATNCSRAPRSQDVTKLSPFAIKQSVKNSPKRNPAKCQISPQISQPSQPSQLSQPVILANLIFANFSFVKLSVNIPCPTVPKATIFTSSSWHVFHISWDDSMK